MLPQVWRASWITADPDPHCPTAAPIFRREWRLPSPVTSAVWHLSGLGSAVAHVNGQPADDTVLGPGQCDWRVAARASSTDVSHVLAGTDRVVLAVELGRGFHDMHSPEVWQWSTAPWRATPRLTSELHLTCADGSKHVLTSDDTWRTSTGGTRLDSLYEGETWDQAHEPEGWMLPGFDDSGWAGVRVVDEPPVEPHRRAAREVATHWLPLREAMAEPIRVLETLPLSWNRLEDGSWVGDVGRVVAGWVRLEPTTDEHLRVSVFHGEMVDPTGAVHCENRFIPTGRFQRDEVSLAGRPWEARHTWKGFRHVQLWGASPEQVTVSARVVGADVAATGSVLDGPEVLVWLDRAFRNTVRANLHWVPTDTPTYEKNGWTGDVRVSLPAMLARFDLRRHLTSWLDDFLDAQLPSGELPVIVPSAGWGYGHGPCSPAPEWTALYPVLVDALVTEYGLDLWPLHREPVARHLDFELGRLDDDGLAVGILGDYLSPGWEQGPPPEDIRFESSLTLREALTAFVHGQPDAPESPRFRRAADELAEAVNRTFLDRASGCYRARPVGTPDDVGFRQTLAVLALDAGIVPDDLAGGVLDALVADIEARDGHHNCGCLGMARLCSVLVRHGRTDLALRVASHPEAPSWEAWRRAGPRRGHRTPDRPAPRLPGGLGDRSGGLDRHRRGARGGVGSARAAGRPAPGPRPRTPRG